MVEEKEIIQKVDKLIQLYQIGQLGGEFMPEDSNPNLERNSSNNYLYFTLPMALNYQRNSYQLWEGAKKTYEDSKTNFVFDPLLVEQKSEEEIQEALTKYKVALQKNKQTQIWKTLCHTINTLLAGDIRNVIKENDQDVNKIREYIQKQHRKEFPYLAGNKICNYWLYVLYQYTDVKYTNIECLTVAPDTHVIKASQRLGVISEEEMNSIQVQTLVAERWNQILKNTKYKPIDIHTPLWLWSRNGFCELK